MNLPQVSIIILNFNSFSDTERCLDSLKKINYPDYEIIVVDNGSLDGSVEKLRKRKDIILIEADKNYGFAEGSNIGVRKAKGKYVVLLNNDTIVDKNWLIEMIKEIKKDKKIAIIGSNIINVGKFYSSDAFGLIINLFAEPMHANTNDKSFTFLVSGCSLLFDKGKTGVPFDKDFFADGEDIYLAWLTRLKGYAVKIAVKSKLDHVGGEVRKKMPKLVEFHCEKNKIMNIFLFYEWKNIIKIFPILCFNILVNLIISIFKLRLFTRLKSYFWVIKNFGKIMKKRRIIQNQRILKDKELFQYITYRISPAFHGIEKIINFMILLYCMIVRLPVRR